MIEIPHIPVLLESKSRSRKSQEPKSQNSECQTGALCSRDAFHWLGDEGQAGVLTHGERKEKLGNQWRCLLAWWETWRLTMPRRRFDLQRPVDAAAEDEGAEVFAGSAVVVGTEVETWVDVAECEASAEETWVEEAWVEEAAAEDLLEEDGAGSLP